MSSSIRTKQFIYTLIYDNHERELAKLEIRHVFKEEDQEKQLFSDIKLEPSSSAFIKSRVDILGHAEEYAELIDTIRNKRICMDGFKVEYVVLNGDSTPYPKRLKKLKDVGYSIEGTPDYYQPTVTYAICCYLGVWYFGVLIKDDYTWRKHQKKPCSYSNSIHQNIAKALVNIAAKGNKDMSLLDACCGVGTIMLEACYAGNKIEGCDINWKVCRDARLNLAHFKYRAEVTRSDIKDIKQRYDATILDLPYNLFSYANEENIQHIIESAARIARRLVIVSTSDIKSIIGHAGLCISDSCKVGKSGKAKFERMIWVCEASGNKGLSLETINLC